MYKVGIEMKKRIKIVLLLIVVMVFCTACDGSVTRALRHDGFSIGEEFVCDAFFGKEARDKIWYMTGDRIINTEGSIYEVSFGQKFTNNMNCRVAETELKVVALFEDKIFKAEDGNYYYLTGQNNVGAYTQVTAADNSYTIYDLLLKDEGVVKATTADSSAGVFYVLKHDGNVYSVTISKNYNTPATIVGSDIVYDQSSYGGPIIDFAYYGNSPATFVRTNSKVFRMKALNSEDCSRFADVTCTYEMVESPVFEQYPEYIAAYNGSMVITSYQKIFTVGS